MGHAASPAEAGRRRASQEQVRAAQQPSEEVERDPRKARPAAPRQRLESSAARQAAPAAQEAAHSPRTSSPPQYEGA